MAGERAEVAGCRDGLADARKLARVHRLACEMRGRRQKRVHLALAFFRLERAARVNQEPPRRHHGSGTSQQSALQFGEAGYVGGAAAVQNIGVASDGPGRRARCVEEHQVGLRRRVPVERIGLDDLGLEMEPGEVLP